MATRISLSEMLNIRSVAIVGIGAELGYYWVHSMLQWPHDLRVWLVSRGGGEVLGRKVYRSVSEIPEKIDYAIVAVPNRYVVAVLREVAAHGAKGATVFTSGYSELGTDEGRAREQELRSVIRSLGIRVIGPNCMGITYPKIGFAFMPTVKRLSGDVGFLSQSGGVAIAVYTAGVEAGVGFSKLFSFGNQVDVSSQEIVDYFAEDDETRVVGAYIEGTRDGRELMMSITRLSQEKPLVVLKGGRSSEGSRAVSSHTGALAGRNDIWRSLLRRSNVPMVETLEDMVATLSVFSLCPRPRSRKVGILAISGGTSVIYTDLCIEGGLRVPRTSPATVDRLRGLVRDVGTGLYNPVDLAADYYSDRTASDVIQIVGEEQEFDSLLIEADVHNVHQVASIVGAADSADDFWRSLAAASKRVVQETNKPVLTVIPEVAYPEQRSKVWNIFVGEGLPVFRNMREAIGALERVCDYFEHRHRTSH